MLQELGRTEEALASYDKAISLNPNSAETYSNRGVVLQELGRTEEALASYDKAISLYSNNAKAHFNRGNALKELRGFDEAIISYKNAISLEPNWPEAYCNQGNILHTLNRFDEAVISLKKAIQLNPGYAEAYSNLGNSLQEWGQLEESLENYDKAIQISPYLIDAHSNRGVLLQKLGRIDEALESYNKAIQINPNLADIQFNKSIALLLSGDFEQGFKNYEWREKNEILAGAPHKRNFSQPLWLGDRSIKNKTILLYSEQGLGDTIQFSRYIPLVKELGAKVILEVQAPLIELFKEGQSSFEVYVNGSNLPHFDFRCPLMSLPLAFKTNIHSIPNNFPYINANQNKVAYWYKKLSSEKGLKVGLVWNGGFRPGQPNLWSVNERRNIPVEKFCNAFNNLRVNFYSLQKGEPAESEIALLEEKLWPNHNFFNYANELNDFSDTAGLIGNLDLIISVDTSTAHLAAAMGKPVWLLNRFDTCWRWLLNRNDSPWYPSLKLYRQDKLGDWDSVLVNIKSDLEALQI